MADETRILPTSQRLSFGELTPLSRSVPLVQSQAQAQPLATSAALSFGTAPGILEEKQAAVAEASGSKQALFGSTQDLRRLGTAIQEGNDLAQDDLGQMIARGDMAGIHRAYGPDVAERVNNLNHQMRQDTWAKNAPRTNGEILGDAALGIGAGAIAGLGGVAALGAGALLGDQAGAAVSRVTNNTAEAVRGFESPEIQDQRELGAVRAGLDQEDTNKRYEAENAAGADFAGLRRFGREALSAAQDLWENPALAGDVTAEGLGSFAASYGIGKVASMAGARFMLRQEGLTGKALEAALKSDRGKALALSISEKGMPLSIGAQEAGGAYLGIQAEIQAMGEADLSENSPEYRSLRAGGFSHEEARSKLANEAGLEGGAIAGLLGAATGKLVSKFEANPLRLGEDFASAKVAAGGKFLNSLKELGKQSLQEATEEGIQGVGSSLAQNLAVQNHADETRGLAEGMGGEFVRGAVAGAGMAAPLRAPSVMAGAADDTSAGLAYIGQSLYAAGKARMDRIKTELDQASPTGSGATQDAVKGFFASARAMLQGQGDQATDAPTDPVSGSPPGSMNEINARVTALMNMGAQEANSLSGDVRNLFLDAGELVSEGMVLPRELAINEVIKELSSGQRSPAEMAASALWLREQAQTMKGLLADYSQNIPTNLRGQIETLRSSVDTFLSNETVAKALESAQTLTSEEAFGKLPEVTPESLGSPEVQSAIQNQDRLAVANPAGVDAAFLRQVLDQTLDQSNGMEASQRARLEAAARLAEQALASQNQKLEIQAKAEAELKATGKSGKASTAARNVVRDEILVSGRNEKYAQRSLSRHQADILEALNQNQNKRAQRLFDHLGNFADHMANKVGAGRRSLEMGLPRDNRVGYRTWTGRRWLEPDHPDANAIGISPFSPVSMALLEDATVDAASVAQTYNNLLEIFGADGSLVGSPKTVPGYSEGITDAEADAGADQSQGGKSQQDATGEAPQADGETATAANPAGDEGIGEAGPGEGDGNSGSTAGAASAGRSAGGLTEDPLTSNLFGEPIDLKGIRRSVRAMNASIRDRKRNLRELRTAQKALYRYDSTAKRPLTAALIKTMKLDPQGPVGLELKHMDVTPKTAPGLFKKDGTQNLDNLVREEWEDALPGITDATGTSWGETYLSEQGLLNLLSEEAAGRSAWLYSRQEAEQYNEDIAEAEQEIVTLEAERDAYRAMLDEGESREQVSGRGRLGGRVRDGRDSARRSAAVAESSVAGELPPNGGTDAADGQAGRTDEGGDGSNGVARGESQSAQRAQGSVGANQGTASDAAESARGADGVAQPVFDNLPVRQGLNRFTRAYVIDPLKAPLLALASPVSHVLGILNDWAGRKSELPTAPSTNMNEGHLDPWRYVMATEVPYLVKRLNERLKAVHSNTKGKAALNGKTPLGSLEEALNVESSLDWLSIRQTRGLNLVDTETGNYDTRLAEAAAMAAVHWYLTTPRAQSLSDEEIAKAFNMDVGRVDAKLRAMANSGLNGVSATEALSRVILQFWGARTNQEAPMSDTRGIVEHLAKELLVVMGDEQGRLITPVKTEILDTAGKPKTVLSLKLEHPTAEKLVEALKGASSFLGDAYAPMAKRPFRFGKPRPQEEARRTQKGNPIGRLGEKITRAIQNQSEVAFLRNQNQMNLMKALGQDTWADLMGFKPVEPGVTNLVHAAAIEGKNTTIRLSWDGVMRYGAELEAHAQANGLDPNTVETFMDYYAASNARMMIEGFNPQADKGMREVAVATRAVLDLSKLEDVQAFWLTVGQSSGLVKTEKGTAVTNATEAERLIDANYGTAIEILRDWVRGGSKAEMGLEIRDQLKAAVLSGSKGKAVSPKLMHTLVAVARFREATENFDQENPNFVHDLSLEADGKTDGPINAIVNFTAGIFTDGWFKMVRRGGLFLNEYDQTLNAQGRRDPNDLYTHTGVLANANYRKRRAWLDQRNDTRAMAEALDYLLLTLGDVKLGEDGQSIEVTRDGVKNPVTITGYGSSEGGIAGKVTGLLLDNLYAALTEMETKRRDLGDRNITLDSVLGDAQRLRDALNLLTHRRLKISNKEWVVEKTTDKGQVPPPLMDMGNGLRFQISPEQFDMLRENLRLAYVKPMSAAIRESFGASALETLELFKTATQIQSAVMLDGFRSEVHALLSAKRDARELASGDFLSEKDYNDIFKRFSKYGAIIEGVDSADHTLNLSIDKNSASEQEFARSFEGLLGGQSNMTMPRLAGVSAAPQVTISRGDAAMMVNFFASEAALEAGAKRSFQVYDGLEMPADLIRVLSEHINKAVLDAWLENPAQDLADSFRDWFRHEPFALVQSVGGHADLARATRFDAEAFKERLAQILRDGVKAGLMTPDRMQELTKRLGRSGTDYAALDRTLTPAERAQISKSLTPVLEDFKRAAEQVRDSLLETARSIQARKNVFKRIGLSVDHMASGEMPYTKEGERFDGIGSEIDWLNRLYEEELANLPDPLAPAMEQPVETGSAEFRSRILAYGSDVSIHAESPVRQMRVKDLLNALDHPTLPKAHAPVFKALRQLAPKDFRVVLGSPEAVTEWRNGMFPEKRGTRAVQLGQTDLANRVIYIGNISGETVLHELLHAVLSDVTGRFYLGDPSLTEVQKAALGNLEKLMHEFTGLSFESEAPQVAAAARAAQDEITRRVGEDPVTARYASPKDRTGALLEFISWSLTNQNLAVSLDTVRVRSKLQGLKRLVDKALRGLAGLLGIPRKLGTTDEIGLRMFQNIRWNSHALLSSLTADETSGSSAGLVLDQLNPVAKNDPDTLRMRALRERFETKIGAHLKQYPNSSRAAVDELDAYMMADDAVNRFQAAGVLLDPEQVSTFRVIQAAMATSMEIAPGALAQTQRIFQKILSGLTTEKLMKDPTDDFEREDKARIFDALVGKWGTEKDAYGRSNLMASVLALAMVDPEFRRVLNQEELPKDRGVVFTSMDAFLESVGESMMNSLATAVSEDGRGFMATVKGKGSRTQLEALDKLAAVLSRVETDDRLAIEKRAGDLINSGDRLIQTAFGVAGSWLENKASPAVAGLAGDQKDSTRAVVADGAARAIHGLGMLMGAEKTASFAEMGISLVNESKTRLLPQTIKRLFAEIVGTTASNAAVHKILNQVKAMVSASRQEYREKLPAFFAKQFSRKLSDSEWSALHQIFGGADIGALAAMSPDAVRALFETGGKSLSVAIRDAQEAIAKVGGRDQKLRAKRLQKAEELAHFMATGEIHPSNNNLLKNARAVARLLGEPEALKGHPDAALVEALDRFITLRALEISRRANPAAWTAVQALVQGEAAGVDFLVHYLVDLRHREQEKAVSDTASYNGWKGYIPAEARSGAQLIVASDAENKRLVTMGFSRLGDYEGSGYELGRRGYYFSTVGGNSTYVQGALQTVHNTAMGASALNGRNVSGLTGGVIAGEEARIIHDTIQQDIQNGYGAPSGQPLVPIYDGHSGEVVAYERSLSPAMRSAVKRNTHLGEMLGAWAGRLEEERLSQKYNESLIDALKENWVKGKREGRAGEYVDISKPGALERVFGHSWEMIPQTTKDYIEQVFDGEDGFMVRQDMVDNALGYRMPSVKDIWQNRGKPEDGHVARAIRDTATFLLGKDALPWAVRAEKGWQAGISVAKNTIVVKSVIVPVSNIASNVIQLMSRGVPVRHIWKGMGPKLVEINTYLRNKEREVEINALLARHRNESLPTTKLKAELKALEDSNKRLSIWPLIKAGEFSTIAEGQTEADAAIAEGTWAEYMQNALDKIPPKLGTFGRYALVTRDTALFQGMSRAVQYGDFLAKAVYFDHLTKAKGVSLEKALVKVSTEFVNYNLLPGPVRSYAESMGLTWFWAYKLRSVGVALNQIQENPLRALLMGYGAEHLPSAPGISVGSPLSDNAASVIFEGRAGYSLGLDMFWSAPSLNPWLNAVS